MKILLVSDVYRYTTNGAAGVVVILADALRAEGHEVKVLSLSTTRESFREGDDYYFSSLPFPVYPEIRQSIVIPAKALFLCIIRRRYISRQSHSLQIFFHGIPIGSAFEQ